MKEDTSDCTTLPEPDLSVFKTCSGSGNLLTALGRLKGMSAEEWEQLTLAYADALRNDQRYDRVVGFGGPGDKGRDVVALHVGTDRFVEDKWDCYQCKHYDETLAWSMIRAELEKFLHYLFIKEYPMPHKYFLVGPCGVGPSLKDMILQSKLDDIKDKLLDSAQNQSSAFLDFIRSFDYSRIGFIEPHELIETLMKSRWGAAIFAMPLEKHPDYVLPNPPLEKEHSARYVLALREAYRDFRSNSQLILDNLERTDPELWKHFEKSRNAFHSTEALFRFYRETVPPDSDYQLLNEVENGINDVFFEPDIKDGYRRVLKAVRTAKQISLANSIYNDVITIREREGACHHLANRSTKPIKWVT